VEIRQLLMVRVPFQIEDEAFLDSFRSEVANEGFHKEELVDVFGSTDFH
jgi:hypothetical protein